MHSERDILCLAILSEKHEFKKDKSSNYNER